MADWDADVGSVPAFQALPPEKQEEIRQNFFKAEIEPNVPPEHLNEVRSSFFESTAPKPPEPSSDPFRVAQETVPELIKGTGRIISAPERGWRGLAVGASDAIREYGPDRLMARMAGALHGDVAGNAIESPAPPDGISRRAMERAAAATEPGFVPRPEEKLAAGLGHLVGATPKIAAIGAMAPGFMPGAGDLATIGRTLIGRMAHSGVVFGTQQAIDATAEHAALTGKIDPLKSVVAEFGKGAAMGTAIGAAGMVPALVSGRLPDLVSKTLGDQLASRLLGSTVAGGVGASATLAQGGSKEDAIQQGATWWLLDFLGNKNFDAQYRQAAKDELISKAVDIGVKSGLSPEQVVPQARADLNATIAQGLRDKGAVEGTPWYTETVQRLAQEKLKDSPGMAPAEAEAHARRRLEVAIANGEVTIDQLRKMNIKVAEPPKGSAAAEVVPGTQMTAPPPGSLPPAEAAPQAAPQPAEGEFQLWATQGGRVGGKVVGFDHQTGEPMIQVEQASGEAPPGEVGDVVTANPAELQGEEPYPKEWDQPFSEPAAPAASSAEAPLIEEPKQAISDYKTFEDFHQAMPGVPKSVYDDAVQAEKDSGIAHQKRENLRDAKRAGLDPNAYPILEHLRRHPLDLESLQNSTAGAGLGELKAMGALKLGIVRRNGHYKNLDHAAEGLHEARTEDGRRIIDEHDIGALLEGLEAEIRRKRSSASMVAEPAPSYGSAPAPKPPREGWMPERLHGALEAAAIKPEGQIVSHGFTNPVYGRIKRGEKGTFLGADLTRGKMLVRFTEKGVLAGGDQIMMVDPWDIAETYEADKEIAAQASHMAEGRAVGAAAKLATGVVKDENIVQMAESSLLKIRMQNKARDSLRGFRDGMRAARLKFQEDFAVGRDVRKTMAQYVRESLDGLKANSVDIGRIGGLIARAQTPAHFWQAMEDFDSISTKLYKKNLIGDIKKTATRLFESPSVDVLFRQRGLQAVVDLDLEGMSDKRRQELAGKIELALHAEQFGEAESLPRAVTEEVLRALRRPLDSLSEGELEEISDTLRMLLDRGRKAQKHKELIHEFRVQRRIEKLTEGAKPLDSDQKSLRRIGEPTPPEMKALRQWVAERVNSMQASYLAMNSTGALFEKMGPGFFENYEEYNAAYARGHNLSDQLQAQLKQLAEELNLSTDAYERIHVVLALQRPGGREHIIKRDTRYGLTEAAREAYVKSINLTVPERRMADAILEAGKLVGLRERINRIAREKFNREIHWLKEGTYYPFANERTQHDEMAVVDRVLEGIDDSFARKNMEQGFTLETTPGAATSLRPHALNNMLKHLHNVANFLEIQPFLLELGEAVNSEVFRRRMGPMATDMMRTWVSNEVTDGGITRAKSLPIMDWVRGNISAATLAWRIPTALAQGSAAVNAMGTLGKVPVMDGYRLMFDKNWARFALETSAELRERPGTRLELEGLKSGFRPRVIQNLEAFNQAGFRWLVGHDLHAAGAVWIAAYRQAIARRGIEINFKKPDIAAARDADRIMRESQGSNIRKDLPLALSAGWGLTGNTSVNRAILQFQTYVLGRASYAIQIGLRHWDRGDRVEAARKWSYLLAGEFLEQGIKGAIGLTAAYILAGLGAKEQQRPERSMEYKFFKTMLGMIPAASPLWRTFESAGRGQVSLPFPMLDVPYQTVAGASRAVFSKNDDTKVRGAAQALFGVARLAGIGGSLTAEQGVRPILQGQGKGGPQRVKRVGQVKRATRISR